MDAAEAPGKGTGPGAGRAAGGAVWTVGGYAAMQVLRFASNIVLTRLVAPELMGVMVLVNLFVQGLHMFSDLGVRQCVIRHERGDDPAFLNTAWTVGVLRGVVLWLGSAAVAWPAAAFYGEPKLLWLMPLAGSTAFLTSLSSTSLLSHSRWLVRGPLVRREVGIYATVYTAVPLALWYVRGAVPAGRLADAQLAVLAVGTVASAVLEMALSYTLPAVARPRLRWCPDSRGQLLRFGGWVFVSTACTFLASQADRLVVGKLSLETLGVYNVAVQVVAIPVAFVAALGANLLFPALSETFRRGDPAGPAFRRVGVAVGVLAGWLVTGVFCVGPAFVDLVYRGKYTGAGEYLQLLAGAAWFSILITPGELLLLALGRPKLLAFGQIARLVALPGLMAAGYYAAGYFDAGGVAGLIVAVGAGEFVRYLVIARFVARAGFGSVARDFGMTALAALVAAGYAAAEPALIGGAGREVRFAAGVVTLTAVWGVVFLAVSGHRPRALARVADRARRTAGRGTVP